MVFKKGDNKDEYTSWLLDLFDEKADSYNFDTTRKSYRGSVRFFSKWLDEKAKTSDLIVDTMKFAFDQNELTKAQKSALTDLLLKFQRHLKDDGQSPNSIKTKMQGVISLFKRYRIEAFYEELNWTRKDTKTKNGMNILEPQQMRDFHKLHTQDFQQLALEIRISTACRVGVFEELRFCDVIDYYDDCMKIRFYPDPDNLDHEFTKDGYTITGQDEYYGFLTPETSRTYKKYKAKIMNELGERFNEKMLVYQRIQKFIRSEKNPNCRHGKNCTCEVNNAKVFGVKQLMVNYGSKKLKKLENVIKLHKSKTSTTTGDRYDISATHHTRKYVNTLLKDVEQIDNGIIEHWVMNHQTGLDDSYRIIKEKRFFEEYQKMIPYLTINQVEAVDFADRLQAKSNKIELDKMQIEIRNLDDKIEEEKAKTKLLAQLYREGMTFEEACKKMGFKEVEYNS